MPADEPCNEEIKPLVVRATHRRLEHTAEMALDVEELRDFQPTEYVVSDIVGPPDWFRFQLSLYPCGEDGVEAYVQIIPPPAHAEGQWSIEQMACEITITDDKYATGVVWKEQEEVNESEDCFGGDFNPDFEIFDDDNQVSSVIVHARVMLPVPPETQDTSLSSIDLTQEVAQVTFRLPTGSCLFLDKRVLLARSEYFRKMLQETGLKEGRTNEVDLSKDPTITTRAITALLHFLMSEKFEPPVDAGDCSHLFEVRQLADRYQQKDLMIQTEKELMKLLSPENVLEFLAHVVGSGCQLEAACLDMISENNCKMLKERKEELTQIVEQNTELTKVLMCLLVDEDGARGKKRKLERHSD